MEEAGVSSVSPERVFTTELRDESASVMEARAVSGTGSEERAVAGEDLVEEVTKIDSDDD